MEARVAGAGIRDCCSQWVRMDKPWLRRWLLVSVGVLSVCLGALGILVPLLPTTPFLLLAAACFIRTSDRLYQWLITQPVLGPYVRNYREHRAVAWQAKVLTLLLLWAVIGYSALGVIGSHVLRIVLLLIALAVTAHVLSLKTLTREMLSKGPSRNAPREAANDGT